MEENKKKIVEMLLNKSLEDRDEEELLDLLIDQPIAIDVDKLEEESQTRGDIIADKLTAVAGSWSFIIGFTLFLIFWIILNLLFIKIDPFPFILLNLLLSCLAALQAPIIMMSQNREAKRDSLRNLNDYKTDLKSELILEKLHDQMDQIVKNQIKFNKEINSLKEELDKKKK